MKADTPESDVVTVWVPTPEELVTLDRAMDLIKQLGRQWSVDYPPMESVGVSLELHQPDGTIVRQPCLQFHFCQKDGQPVDEKSIPLEVDGIPACWSVTCARGGRPTNDCCSLL